MDVGSRFLEILKVLSRHQVEFILVGGVAAILEGAPVSTLDLDIVVRPTEEARERLLAALLEVNARYLDPAGRHILPDRAKLATLRIHRLVTNFGPLDVLESIGHGLAYSDLVGETQVYEVEGVRIPTLRLETIIRSKEEANREKDRAVLPVLYRALRWKKGMHGEAPLEEST
jgi:predicted nucleotidyltransferase